MGFKGYAIFSMISKNKSIFGDLSRGWHEGSLFYSYYTEV